jgi:hypothetical protein
VGVCIVASLYRSRSSLRRKGFRPLCSPRSDSGPQGAGSRLAPLCRVSCRRWCPK